MTGLDRIIERIEDQANEAIKDISGASLNKREEMLKKAETEAKIKYDAIIEEAHKKCAFNLETAKAQSATLLKKKVLAKKVEILDETILAAKQALQNLSDGEFCDLVMHMAAAKHDNGDAVVCFNERCLEKLSSDFEKTLNEKISAGSLKISQEPCDIPDGFIIKYGLIEQNCTFEAIIDVNEQAIKDEIAKILFA